MNYYAKKMAVISIAFEHFILIKVIKYEVIKQFKDIRGRILSPTVHLNDILSKNEPNVMKLQLSVQILRKRPQI